MMRAHRSAIAYDNPKLKSLLTYATVRCFWEAILGGSGVALDIQTKILRKIDNQNLVQDFYQDFRSDFERSDPATTSSLKQGIKCS